MTSTSSGPDVVVLDYGSGNLRSVVRAVERAGATVTLTGDFETALAADGLVVPGVGAYAARSWDLVTNDRTAAPLVTWAEHGGDRFVAAVENGPLAATQFHPEKSGDAGAELLKNWVASLRA